MDPLIPLVLAVLIVALWLFGYFIGVSAGERQTKEFWFQHGRDAEKMGCPNPIHEYPHHIKH